MKGTRIGIRLHMVSPASHEFGPTIEFGGRVLEVRGHATLNDLKDALYQIETCINEHLPHLRLHTSLEETNG